MINFTDEQRANLDKLATYLEKMDPVYAKTHFLMATYAACIPGDFDENLDGYPSLAYLFDDKFEDVDDNILPANFKDQPENSQYACGTCACAVGHGPAAGIAVSDADYSWDHYTKRVFGVENGWFTRGTEDIDRERYSAWDYMFGPGNVDDPYAAAARIRRVLNGEHPWLATA